MLLKLSSIVPSLLVTLVGTVTVAAAEVGNEGFVVPPLSCFANNLISKFDLTAAQSDLSGVTFNPSTQTLFTVNNGDRMIYEISPTDYDTTIQTWNVSDLTLDLEGISAIGGRTFVITDENPATVVQVDLLEDGTHANSKILFRDLEAAGYEPAGNNLGFEGVTYLPGGQYVMVQEAAPTKLWSFSGDDGIISNLTDDLKEASPFGIWSIGGLTRGGDATDEVFIMVKSYVGGGRTEEGDTTPEDADYFQKGIFRYNLTSGQVTERFGGNEICNMGQPEGITFWKDEDSNKVYMLVVGETVEARLFEANLDNCTDTLGTINDMELAATCPKPVQTIAACEKTLDDGGCGWLRCDKDITDHTKICTDDEPGVTDCSQDQCYQHCNASNFVGDELTGKICTHWAYDVAEKECYIFAGCNNEKFDADYTLYAMQDYTCERTIEDYPLGCEQRRCNKDISTHNKICTDDQPGVTDCTLEDCKTKCEVHTDFTCTTYSYDAAEKECYLFETCMDEGYDEDYSTYVLVDPTCDKNRQAGGCIQRRCDKDITPHVKICVDDTPAQQCSMAECEMHCATKTFDDLGAEAYCTHWAYDEVDQECYLFHGCIAEKYDDDYVLFTQSYGERQELLTTSSNGNGEEEEQEQQDGDHDHDDHDHTEEEEEEDAATGGDEDADADDEEEGECGQDAASDEGVVDAWSSVEDLMLVKCDEDDEGCDYDKTGTEIVYTYDFSVIAESNETKAYDSSCAAVGGVPRSVVKTISVEEVVLSCTAETSSHIPYKVHLQNYFQCTGLTCGEGDFPMDGAISFAVKVVDQNQNGVTCVEGDVSGVHKSFASVGVGLVIMAFATVFTTL